MTGGALLYIGRMVLRKITVRKDGKRHANWALVESVRTECSAWARVSEGCYLLRTNILDWSPEDL